MVKNKAPAKVTEEAAPTAERAEVRPSLPPYVSWKTFDNFLLGLRMNMPGRIDRSVLGGMSGATQSQLISALRFFGMITEHGTPTDKLRDLVKKEGQERKDTLGPLMDDAYRNVFPEDFDYQSGTYAQLSSVFANTGAQGETLRKAIGFYLSAGKAADLMLSPYFTVRGARGPRKRPAGREARASDWETEDEEGEELPPPPPAKTKFEVLMEKFPALDPAWPPEVQAKWFDAFERIQKTADEGE